MYEFYKAKIKINKLHLTGKMKPELKKSSTKSYWLITVFFIVLKLCLHLLTGTNYELHRDEMLYFNMGSHPAFGYLTVPPVTGFFAFLVKNIFGYSVFGIRLVPALFGAATLFIIAKMVKDLGGGILALTIAATAFLFAPGFLLLFSLFTPNAFEYFLWTTIIYLVFKMAQTENKKLWIWIGILLGISFLTKYSVLFLTAGFFIAFLIGKQRKLLNSRWFYLAILLGAIIILPNIIWQYNHNWPVVFHFEQLQKTQLEKLTFTSFFTDLFQFSSAFLILVIIGLLALLFSKQEKKYRFIGIGILTTILLFFITKGKAYYVLGLFSFLIAFGGYFIEKYIKQKSLVISALAVIAIYSLLSLPLVIPVMSPAKLYNYSAKTSNWIAAPFARWEDGKVHPVSQVYADMTGWNELSENVAKAYHLLNETDQKCCTIYGERNYGYAGAIHFYGKKYNLPEPVTFHESYLFWAPDSIPHGPLIYIGYNSDELQPLFNQIEETGHVQDTFFQRERSENIFVSKPENRCTGSVPNTRIQ